MAAEWSFCVKSATVGIARFSCGTTASRYCPTLSKMLHESHGSSSCWEALPCATLTNGFSWRLMSACHQYPASATRIGGRVFLHRHINTGIQLMTDSRRWSLFMTVTCKYHRWPLTNNGCDSMSASRTQLHFLIAVGGLLTQKDRSNISTPQNKLLVLLRYSSDASFPILGY